MNTCDLLRSIVKRKGSVIMEASGSSMSPFLLPGEKVRLVPATNLNPGDVVVHPGRRSGLPVLHRIIEKKDERIKTMGDGAFAVTAIKQNQVVAKLSHVWSEQLGIWCSIPPAVSQSTEIASISFLLAEGNNMHEPERLLEVRNIKASNLRSMVLAGKFGTLE